MSERATGEDVCAAWRRYKGSVLGEVANHVFEIGFASSSSTFSDAQKRVVREFIAKHGAKA